MAPRLVRVPDAFPGRADSRGSRRCNSDGHCHLPAPRPSLQPAPKPPHKRGYTGGETGPWIFTAPSSPCGCRNPSFPSILHGFPSWRMHRALEAPPQGGLSVAGGWLGPLPALWGCTVLCPPLCQASARSRAEFLTPFPPNTRWRCRSVPGAPKQAQPRPHQAGLLRGIASISTKGLSGAFL